MKDMEYQIRKEYIFSERKREIKNRNELKDGHPRRE
jgi:hypothetical protein